MSLFDKSDKMFSHKFYYFFDNDNILDLTLYLVVTIHLV